MRFRRRQASDRNDPSIFRFAHRRNYRSHSMERRNQVEVQHLCPRFVISFGNFADGESSHDVSQHINFAKAGNDLVHHVLHCHSVRKIDCHRSESRIREIGLLD